MILANTVHPWSVGATGLYSHEYFSRIAAALRPGGLAAQSLPIEMLGADHLAAILRTFFAVFEEGGLWWGANNHIVLWLQSRVAREERIAGLVTQADVDLSAGRIDAAEDGLRRAVAADPYQRDARFGLAALCLERGDSGKARAQLSQLLDHHPNDGEAWNLMGVVLSRNGSAIDASKAFARALEADPFPPEAMVNAGLLAVEAGERAAALDFLERLRAISPFGETTEERALLEALGRAGES